LDKENLAIIILAPTLLGGFWQTAELAYVGAPYIRFFSVSQLAADGLLMLFLLFMIGLMTVIPLRDMLQMPKPNPVKPPLRDSLQRLSILTACLVAFYFFYLQSFFKKINPNGRLSTLEFCLMAFGIVFTFIFLRSILNIFFEMIGKEKITQIVKHRWLGPIVVGICGTLFLTILSGMIRIVPWLHGSYLLPENFRNNAYIGCKIEKNNPGKKAFHIQYFNDKYIFVELTTAKGQPQTEVLKFDEFFTDTSCSTATH